MARIRTIKPEFFRNLKLFKAEQETKLPLRISYAGLWTACDREGRFKWHPEELKLDCLPYDNVDFSRVLDALATRGYLVKYRVGGGVFGCIPSWLKHQFINNREMESILPQVSEGEVIIDASGTGDPRALSMLKGKGNEGKVNRKGKRNTQRRVADAGHSPNGSRPVFVPPSLIEVSEYCQQIESTVNPEAWWNYYQSNGWRVGKNRMIDWQASVRNWKVNGVASHEPEVLTLEQLQAKFEAEERAKSATG